MTSLTLPLRSESQRVRPTRRARLLRLELHHSTMIWLLPLLGALFYFDPFRKAAGYPPFWFVRSSVILHHLVPDFSLFAAGVAAWTGSREGRRQTVDLVTIAARPRWATALASFAATTIWTLAAFLGCVAVLYGFTATQASWGGPPWWPVAAGAAVLCAFCALGFAAGVLLPGRFTAPLAALVTFLVLIVAFRVVINESHPTFALLSPMNSVPHGDAGVFFHYFPDLYIVQIMFFAGIAVAVLGGLGLATASGSRIVWRTAAVVTALGAGGSLYRRRPRRDRPRGGQRRGHPCRPRRRQRPAHRLHARLPARSDPRLRPSRLPGLPARPRRRLEPAGAPVRGTPRGTGACRAELFLDRRRRCRWR